MAKLAVLTGTSSGIGAALLPMLLDAGWRVLGLARRPAPVTHERYHHQSLDLGEPAALAAYFEGPFLEAYQLDACQRVALINNAATLDPVGPLFKAGAAELARALTVNIAAPTWLMGFFALRVAAPLRVVNLSSGAATNAYPGWGAYCISKAGLRMASKALQIEAAEIAALKGRDIRVVEYAPGVVDTAMQVVARSSKAEDFPRVQRFKDLHAQGELADPSRPAAEILDLLTEDIPAYSERRLGD